MGFEGSDIAPRIGVEQPTFVLRVVLVFFLDPDFDRLLRFLVLPDVADVGFGPRARDRGLERVVWAASGPEMATTFGPGQRTLIQFVTEYDRTAADADQENVDAEADPGPEMNLEKRLPEPKVSAAAAAIDPRTSCVNNIAVLASRQR